MLVAIAVAGTFFYFKKAASFHTPAVQLAPAETILFVHFPDLKRTAERWPKTGLAQIGAEPEMQAFLAKPLANAPQMKLWEGKLSQIAAVEPGEAFLAVTSIDGSLPHFIAGVSFAGRKAAAEALLSEPRAEMKRTWPAGKSDVTMQGHTEIETFTYEDTIIGEAFQNNWYFVSNDMELLRRTLDVPPQGLGPKALAANELFQKSTAHLPAEGEAVLYAQVGVLTERLVSLLVASGQTLDPKQIDDLKKMQAVAWGTKFEGEQMRDTLFLLSPGNAAELPLARSSLAFSNPGTFLTYATALPATFEVPESSLVLGAMLPGFSAVEKGLADKGLKWSDFGKAFGPEFGVVGNWAANAGQPSVLLALDIRDATTARGFVEVFTGDLPGSPTWGRKEEEGVTIYQSPAATGLVPLAPTAALTEKFLVVGFSEPDVLLALRQLKTGKAAITVTSGYSQTVKTVGTPTAGFGYLDLKGLFERSYGMLRPFIAMSLAFSADAGKYIDAGKLPNADVIGKHLTPSVYSQSVTQDGTLIESVGTLTFNQLLIGMVGGTVAYAYPMLGNLGAGFKLDPNTFQLTPPRSTPDSQDNPPKNEAPDKQPKEGDQAPSPNPPVPKPDLPQNPAPPAPQL